MQILKLGPLAQLQKHDHEEEEHEDRARIDQHLEHGEKRSVQQNVHPGKLEEHDHQREGAMHRVVAGDHHDGREHGDRRQGQEDDLR